MSNHDPWAYVHLRVLVTQTREKREICPAELRGADKDKEKRKARAAGRRARAGRLACTRHWLSQPSLPAQSQSCKSSKQLLGGVTYGEWVMF